MRVIHEYEAPRLIVVGAVEELTRSENFGNTPDGVFTHIVCVSPVATCVPQ